MAPKVDAISGASGGVGWIATGDKDSSTVLGHHAIGPLSSVDASQRCGEREHLVMDFQCTATRCQQLIS